MKTAMKFKKATPAEPLGPYKDNARFTLRMVGNERTLKRVMQAVKHAISEEYARDG